jgi:monoamine oxidase
MARPHPDHIVVIGAGAAGLMAARELARAGKRETLLEVRDRCGGRIHPIPAADFGYPAEGGAEFVHGEWSHLSKLGNLGGSIPSPPTTAGAAPCARIKHLVTSRSQERMHLF